MRIERSGEGLAVLPVADDQIEVHFSALGMSEGEIEALHPYVFAAVREIEDFAGLALIRHTITVLNVQFSVKGQSDWWSGVRQGIPEAAKDQGVRPVFLPVRPAVSLSSVALSDDGTALDVGDYRIYGQTDPEFQVRGSVPVGAVDVAYLAGYGDEPAAVPADLRLAVLDQALRLYERRGDEVSVPLGLCATAARIVARHRRVRL